MYAMTATWCNTTYDICNVSTFNDDASIGHTLPLICVFWCLNCTNNWKLRIGGALGEGALAEEEEGILRCYVPSDHAGLVDDYKCTNGQIISFGEMVNW
jgi:hypothetical protein